MNGPICLNKHMDQVLNPTAEYFTGEGEEQRSKTVLETVRRIKWESYS